MKYISTTKLFDGSYAFTKDGSLLNGDALKAFFVRSSQSFELFKFACVGLNGSWAVVIDNGEEIFAATDHRSTRPLFFRQNNGEIYFSENGFDLIFEGERFDIDADEESFFSLNGFLLGDRTLHPDIKRLFPSSALRFDGARTIVEFYDNYVLDITRHSTISYTETRELLKNTFDKVFERVRKFVGDRWIVLPLTAGRDSRLIASLLKKAGFEKVHCITYGIGEDCFENRKAKIIAGKLGFRHTFIHSIPKDCDYLGYTEDEEIIDYLKYICSLSSGYYFAEYLPAKWVLENFSSDNLPVVLPGHNGDEIRGESLVHPFLLDKSPDKMIDYLTLREGGNRVLKPNEFRIIRSMVENEINKYPAHFDTICRYEHYINYEVMPKFYTNSSKSWRYFGIPVLLPFLDKELCDVVSSIPIAYRWNRKVYEDVTNEYYSMYGIRFDDDMNSERIVNTIKFKTKEFLRPMLIRILNRRNRLWYGNTIGFRRIMGGKLLDDVKRISPYSPTNENGLACAWILLKIKERYSKYIIERH